jgi:hypothetical protein
VYASDIGVYIYMCVCVCVCFVSDMHIIQFDFCCSVLRGVGYRMMYILCQNENENERMKNINVYRNVFPP